MSDLKQRVRFTDPISRTARRVARLRLGGIPLLVAGLAVALGLWAGLSRAANPSSGTLTPTSGPLTYTAGPFAGANVSAQALGLPDCTAPMSCDTFTLTVDAATQAATREVQVQIAWDLAAADFDLYVLDATGTVLVKSSASGNDPETAIFEIPLTPTTYQVLVAPFNPIGQSFRGIISLVPFPPVQPPGTGIAPRYQPYAASSGMGNSAGEPSIGVDWIPRVASLSHGTVNTGGVVFFTSGIEELRASFDDCSSPAADLWEDVSSPFVQQSVLSDPIGFVDHRTGRMYQLDLAGGEGNSFAAYSDDDGNTTTPMQGGGSPAGPDHETLGAGPYNDAALPPPPPHPLYPNAVYYCSQNIAAEAECSRSDDGGQSFGPGVPLFNVAQCTGSIHGHVKVAPDGTVYVPNSSCATGNGTAGIAVSTDNGLTWTDRTVPGSTGNADPSVGVGLNSVGRPAGQTTSTIYLGWTNGDGHALVAVSHDRGLTWVGTHDAGAAFGIRNSVFPAVVAGDDNRAAFGFLGTTTGGNSSDEATFRGLWHLYIATTYDGGLTWTTVDATPNDPVQVGSICLLGLSCGNDRNLLDFNDFTLDREGRALFGFADGCLPPGCTSATVNGNPPYATSRSAKASIARQSGGRRLLSAFDPPEPSVPAAPRLASATRTSSGVDVRWFEPDNGGSPLTHYNIFRGTSSGGEFLLASTANAQKPEYVDTTADSNTTYYYYVTATNTVGTGSYCGELVASGAIVEPRPPDSCGGVDVVIDPAGDAVNPAASGTAAGSTDQVDVTGVSFSVNAGKTMLTTRLRLKNLVQQPVNGTAFTSYFVAWTSNDGRTYATEVDVDSGTRSAFWGEFDPNTNQLNTFNSATHTFTTGPDGTIAVDVPLGGVGSPTIPITDPAGTPAVTDPYAIVIAGEGVLGVGLVFTQPEDRAPDSSFGQRWAVCPSGPATFYSLGAPVSANPGAAFSVTLAARDASNNVATGYTGTVHFTGSDGLATLPANYTFTAGDFGVHTFSVTLRTSGNQTITATDTATSSIAGSAIVAVNTTPPPNTCISTPTLVVTDASGDQIPFPSQQDITSVSVGEDYQFIGSQRLVFKVKVADLNTIPANGIWRARWTFGATTYYVAMNSDGNSSVTYDYGTQSGSLVSSVGAIESGTYATDGTITMAIAMSKVGNSTAGSILTGVNGLTQQNVGGTLFTGVDSTSSGTYTVRAQAPTCTPVNPPQTSVTYLKGGMTFSPNVTVRAPYIGQDVEPSMRTDRFGNAYVAAIRGVPGGTDLWYFDLRPTVPGPDGSPIPNPTYDPYMRNPQYRGQPDAISGSEDASVGGDGGGDVDMAVAFDESAPGSPPYLAYASLVLSNISTQRSTDRGVTWVKNGAGNVTGGVPGDDRQWLEFFGKDQVYLLYRSLAPAVSQIQRSIDGGLTYGPARTAGLIGQVGGIDIDQNDGTVYISGSTGVVAVGIPPAPGLEPVSYTVHTVAGTGKAHLFFTVKVAQDGTVYACYSDDVNVFIQYSKDKGNTWSAPIRVSDGAETRISIFPWLETGPGSGTIGVVWYGTDTTLPVPGSNVGNWKVFYAHGTAASTDHPTFRQAVASDHIIHAVNISEAGLVVGGSSPNRNLADFFQVAFDPTGAAVIAYADDHNDFAGHTFVARQIGGPAVNGGTVPAPVEGNALPPPLPFSTDGSQVVDFARDVRDGGNSQLGGLVVLPVDDPLDILSIKYSEEYSGGPLLAATMKVSDMTAIPPSSNWRVNFSANAAFTQMSPTGGFTFGLADRSDQFFLRTSTDSSGVQTFTYGTTVRGFDGSITYTDRGAADSGAFDAASKTITMKVALSKLNTILTAAGRPILQRGSILAGLRGQAFTNGQGNNVKIDSTRGGTQFTLNFPPAAVNDSYDANQDRALTVGAPGVLANDTDLDGDPLSATLTGGPSHGTLMLDPGGSFVYTPGPGYVGSDSFTYTAGDGLAVSGVGTVSITVYRAAGVTPDGGGVPGTPLTVFASGGNLTLTWGSSCSTTDTDYEVYEGTLGDYYSHTQKFCSTGGAVTSTFPQTGESTYYLIVPRNAAREGSYGRASDGSERPQGGTACVPQAIVAACP